GEGVGLGYGTKLSGYTDFGLLREQAPLPGPSFWRPWRAVSAGAGHRSGLGATVASGLRRNGPPEWACSDRGERSPPERATGVDLERPWRAVSAGAGHRSGLGVLPSILRDIL